jgi:spermidine/putrescine transport system ATP-binding protein
MSDRIAVMNRGRVDQVADPEQVYERPATTFVAGFIGVSNLMPATVEEGDRVRLENGPTVSTQVNGFRPGDRCHAVVRPEKLGIERADSPGDPSIPSVEGVVESSLYLGTSTQIIVDLGNEVKMTVLYPNADEAARQGLPGGGARVRLSWAPEHMHLVRESPSTEAGSNDLNTGGEKS